MPEAYGGLVWGPVEARGFSAAAPQERRRRTSPKIIKGSKKRLLEMFYTPWLVNQTGAFLKPFQPFARQVILLFWWLLHWCEIWQLIKSKSSPVALIDSETYQDVPALIWSLPLHLYLQNREFHVCPGATWREDSKSGKGRSVSSQRLSLLFVTSETMRPGTYSIFTILKCYRERCIEGDTLIVVKKPLKLTNVAMLLGRLTILHITQYWTEYYENKQLIVIYKIIS